MKKTYLSTIVITTILLIGIIVTYSGQQIISNETTSFTNPYTYSIENTVGYSDTTTTVNCELPSITKLTSYKTCEIPITKNEAYLFASTFSDINTNNTRLLDSGEIHIQDSDQSFTIKGKNHILYTKLNENPVMKDWNDVQLISVANKQLNEIHEFLPDSIVEMEVSEIKESWGSISRNITHTVRVTYSLSVNGIELIGNGADFYFDICNDTIYSYEIHYPVLVEAGVLSVDVSPEEAVYLIDKSDIENNLIKAQKQNEYTVETEINNVELRYYYNFLTNENGYLELWYYIEGTHNIYDDKHQIVDSVNFSEYISSII